MHPIFHISKSDVQQLDDTQARELVARLCQAELRQKGLCTEAVTWGGDQRAADGGVDVRVAKTDAVTIDGFIPRTNTIFQVKAEKSFAATRIKNEMAPASQLKPKIAELAECIGAYIIANTKNNNSDSTLRNRQNAMGECITAAGLTGKIHVDFYDSQRIADWASQHPVVVIWVKFALAKPINGWQPYAPWAYHEKTVTAEYILDDKAKIIGPSSNTPIPIAEAIKRLRQELREKQTSVRIVGLSGVGKTRFVQALFDARLVPEVGALDSNNVIYTDISDAPSPQPNVMIEALLTDVTATDVTATVVIVDNCGAATHTQLTTLITKPNSKLSLVTLEYDIRDDLPDDTDCYRLEASSDDLIKQLLARHNDNLSPIDIDKIAEFAGGNARIAFALAGRSEKKGQLSKLENEELFSRLFHQKNSQNEDLMRSAEACSLLYSFDSEDDSTSSELSLLASLAEVTIPILHRQVSELQRRGLVQQRGKWKAILPHAIANRLANRALENIPKNTILQKFITNGIPRVSKSFAHRLNFLHESKKAREIATELLNAGGLCGDLANLGSTEMQIFKFIAPVDQHATLAALLRASDSSEFIATTNFYRQDFIKTTRSLAYDVACFEQAITILLRFANAEIQAEKNDSTAQRELQELFWHSLSGTLAPPTQRAEIVRQLLHHNDPVQSQLGIYLLSAALKAGGASSSHQFDFGAHSRGFGWQPETNDDIFAWYGLFMAIVHDVGTLPNALGAKVRHAFAEKFQGLWVTLHIDLHQELQGIAEAFHRIDGWPDGWRATQEILQHDKARISPKALEALKKLDELLTPADLALKIRAQVLFNSFFYDIAPPQTGEDQCQKYQSDIMRMGAQAGNDINLILGLLPELLHAGIDNNIRIFAQGITNTFHDIPALLKAAKEVISTIEPSTVNLRFICALIDSWNKTAPAAVAAFLDSAIEDATWGEFFPSLREEVPLDDAGYMRLMRAIELAKSPIRRFLYLLDERVTAPLSAEQVMTLISSIAKKPAGISVALEILDMVIFGSKEKDDSYRLELKNRCIHFLQELDWKSTGNMNDNLRHHFNDILTFTLNAPIAEQHITLILQKVFVPQQKYYFKTHFAPFLQYHTKKTLDTVYQPDADGSYNSALTLMRDDAATSYAPHFFQPPAQLVLEWCQVSPDDRLPFIAQICPLFTATQTGVESGEKNGISELAKNLFKLAKDKATILDIFIKQFVPRLISGYYSNFIKMRVDLLDELNDEHDPVIAKILINAKAKLNKAAATWADWEESKDRSHNERFE